MFNIDSSIFMSKLTKFGIHAVPDNRKMKDNVCSFFFPKLYHELPDLIMNCVCDGNTDSILFALSVPITRTADIQIIQKLCCNLNAIGAMHTKIQDNLFASTALIDLSTVNYSSDTEASTYAASAVLKILVEFERNYAAAYQYATTGNIDYLR